MSSNKKFNSFPPPKFLDMPFAGLSINDLSVRCIQFSKKRKGLAIEKYTEKNLAPGTVVAGQINNLEELVKTLQELKKEIDLSYIKISLPEEKGYLFTAKFPIVKNEEIRSAIESKIEENVPVPPGELIFDYKLLPVRDGFMYVVVSAIPITVVETYVDLMEKSGLSLLSLEIESQAIASAILTPDSQGTVLVVNFEQDKVGLYVVTDRVVRFTSTVAVKSESSHSTDFLAQEIKRLFVYWHTLKDNIDRPERKIEEIVVCGEKFNDSIISYLSSRIQTKVSMGNVWTNVFDISANVPEITFNDSLKYASAIGLALPSDVLI